MKRNNHDPLDHVVRDLNQRRRAAGAPPLWISKLASLVAVVIMLSALVTIVMVTRWVILKLW